MSTVLSFKEMVLEVPFGPWQLQMEMQVSIMALRSFNQCWLIHPLQSYFVRSALATVLHALIITQMEYCNVLLHEDATGAVSFSLFKMGQLQRPYFVNCKSSLLAASLS